MKKWIWIVPLVLAVTVSIAVSAMLKVVMPAVYIYSEYKAIVSCSDIRNFFIKPVPPEKEPETVEVNVTVATVKSENAGLRLSATDMVSETDTVKADTTLAVVDKRKGENGCWYLVLNKNKLSWISESDISLTDIVSKVDYVGETHDTSRPCHMWRELTVKVDAAVLYSDVSVDSTPLAIVHRGEKYLSYGDKGDGNGLSWFKLNINGVEGYISRKLFTVKNVFDPIPDRDFEAEKPVIYLSPSRQGGNPYKTGNTTEKAQMEAVGAVLYEKLKEYDCTVYVATPKFTLAQRTEEAYSLGTDIYIAIHSNATGSEKIAYGANAYYFPGCAQSLEYAKSVIESLNMVTVYGHEDKQIHDGMVFTDNFGYAEVRDPGRLGMISILVETEYHDNVKGAKWIIGHHEELADGLLESIVKTLKLTKRIQPSATDISASDA